MTPMRALILTWEYPPLIEGGLARVVNKQAEGLVQLGVEVHVLTRGDEGPPQDEMVGGVHVHRVREPTRPSDLNEFVAWVERMNSDMLAAGVELGDRHDFDIVHGHDWLVANACDHLARRFGCPLVTTIHATEHGRHQGWVNKHPQIYIHGVERWITNRSDRVCVCSTFMREQVVDVFGVPQDQVEVIPNGIDTEDIQPQDDAELRRLRAEFAEPDERLVLLVGRLVYEKGFQFALEALPKIIEKLPNTRFVVAGSGTHEEELRRQAEELGLMEHGTFVGWIGDDVLHSLYAIADVCVVPSLYEPFGLVALEAMASSCPCIVADTGGLREVVPHDEVGLRFRARDPDSLAEMTIRMLDDAELCRRLTAEAFRHLERFDWADVAERTAELYDELAGARSTPAAEA
jgi:glycogen(starch) synthase